MKTVIGVNGIHSDGETNTDAFLNAISNHHRTDDYDYPERWALSVYSKKRRMDDGKGLLHLNQQLGNNCSVIAHSYGCLLTIEAMLQGAQFDKVFFFGAAASSDTEPYNLMLFNELYNIYNPKDMALKAGALLPLHPFGHLGYSGYRGPYDARIRNINGYEKSGLLRHSHYFDDDHKKQWINFILEKLED